MKKRIKKYNPSKILRVAGSIITKPLIASFITGDDLVNLFDIKKNKLAKVDLITAKLFSEVRYAWSVLLAVICRDDSGVEYIKTELVTANQEYFQHELIDFLNIQHKALLDKANERHLIGAAWLASPVGRVWDDKEAMGIFNTLGAFSRIKDPSDGMIYVTKETMDIYAKKPQMA